MKQCRNGGSWSSPQITGVEDRYLPKHATMRS
jgi:hypothetical protein